MSTNKQVRFVATKRRLKPASVKRQLSFNGDASTKSDFEPFHENANNGLNKYVPGNGVEIITMVSLVSPTGSDNEEAPPPADRCQQRNAVSATNQRLGCCDFSHGDQLQTGPVNFRKSGKSVSFQQTAMQHAIRSFSACLSTGRAMMSASSSAHLAASGSGTSSSMEKSTTGAPAPIRTCPSSSSNSPRKRLLRSATQGDTGEIVASPTSSSICRNQDNLKGDDNGDKSDLKLNLRRHKSLDCGTVDDEVVQESNNERKFLSLKEKKCWDMYCKMTDKGVSVAYDTLLRGMLTPTEYRLRRGSLQNLSQLE